MKPWRLTVYRDRGAGWRWRLVAPNGRITADSAEAYVSRRNAARAAGRLHLVMRGASVLDP